MTNASIEKLGVPWTYRILSLCSLVAKLGALLLLREVHHGRGDAQRVTARQDLHFRIRDFIQFEVLLVVFWGMATELGYITLMYSIPSFATSIGLTPTQGSITNAILNLGQGIGRPPLGYFSDRFGRINMACFATALCGIWCFALWIPTQGFALLCIFALLAGSMCGTFWSTVTPILAEVAGISRMGRIFSAICLYMVLPTTFAEAVAM
jgi:MFS family permease